MVKQRAPRTTRTAAPPAPGGDGWLTEDTVELLRTIIALRTVEEAERFFRDLCTVPELHTLAARWQVAKLLDLGVHYGEIARRTGASTATITRINSWRRFGMGGYRLLLDRMRTRRR